jgi:hypothetical protein
LISARQTTDALRRLDIRDCARAGVLRPGHASRWIWRRGGEVTGTINVVAEDWRLILSYRHRSDGGEWQDEIYPVHIVRTPCHYGGSRPWFVCPVDGCGRRVAILYDAQIFACRRCHRLAYASTREGTADRAARRADRIRDRLGWTPGILNGAELWRKPKWMRWPTFGRLAREHKRHAARALATMVQPFPGLR